MRSGRRTTRRRLLLVAGAVAAALDLGAPAAIASADPPRRDLTELSLAELASVEVTTVGRAPEALAHTAAAVFVITQQDIRRSGATTLAEALRLAPGIQVSRINSNQWAIGMRGFASRLSRSVLVLIDGRSVYTPLFAGTYWEVQDVLLEDIERIEVIRGPGGTLWGANAVNGVINIITRSARETLGTFVEAGLGNEERGFVGARWGGALGPNAAVRVYGKYFDRDAAFHPDGSDFDDWHMAQGGFRLDSDGGPSTLTLQGDAYAGRAGERVSFAAYDRPFSRTVVDDALLGGGNLRGRWSRSLPKDAEMTLQVYYDHTHRVEPTFDEDRDTGDADIEYRRPWGRHLLVSGVGYRFSHGATGGVPTVRFLPAARTDHIFSAFAQDRFEISPERLSVTVGAKLERNHYSGLELQPSVRALWVPRPRHSLWAAVTRAVRTPSRVDRDLELTASLDPSQPVFARVAGSDGFLSERAIVYEGGYRLQVAERLLFDAALFHNRYTNLFSLEPGTPFLEGVGASSRSVIPFLIANGVRGRVSGAEIAAEARLTGAWRLSGSYSFLDMDLATAAGSRDTTTVASTEGASPRHRMVLRSSVTAGAWQLDASWRRISALPAQAVAVRSSVNARVGWRPWAPLEVSVVGRDLLRPHHAEFGGGVEPERSLYGEVAWRF